MIIRKYLFKFLTAFFLLTMFSVNSEASESLLLNGQVTNIRLIEENARSIQLEFSVDFTLKNNSESNIILYEPDFHGINFVLFKQDENKKPTHLHSGGGRRSNYFSPEMVKLQKKLKSAKPPLDSTIILKSGESFNFKETTIHFFYMSRSSSSINQPWDVIVKASSLRMTIAFEMFPGYLDVIPNSKVSFGKLLQKRWSKYGYLWLDDIESEPFPVDLSSFERL